MPKRYTQEEYDFIKENYETMSDSDMAKKLGRTKKSVEKARLRLNLYRHKPLDFTEEQEKEILSLKMPYKKIAEIYGVPTDRIRQVFRKHGRKSNLQTKWTDEEIEFIKKHYKEMSDAVIGEKLGRSIASVMKKRVSLGLTKDQSSVATERRKRADEWTSFEETFLKKNYGIMSVEEISDFLGRSEKGVEKKAQTLGLTLRKTWSEKEDEVLREYVNRMSVYELSYMLNRSVKAIKHRVLELGLTTNNHRTSQKEKLFEAILQEFGVRYDTQVRIGKDFQFYADFVVGDVIFEVKGDYWHCNPRVYEYPINRRQEVAIERDKLREEYFASLGYKVVTIWEYDLDNNPSIVREQVALSLGN